MSGEGSAAAAPTRRRVPLAVAPPPGNPRFGGLDALRGMAAIAVVVTHCAAYTNNLPTTTDHSAIELVYLRVGQLGVCMFFALSGFLLYRPFLAAQIEGGRPQPFGAYARRRVLRVVPAYWFALTVLSIVPGLAGMFDAGWWKQYLFLGIYSPNPLARAAADVERVHRGGDLLPAAAHGPRHRMGGHAGSAEGPARVGAGDHRVPRPAQHRADRVGLSRAPRPAGPPRSELPLVVLRRHGARRASACMPPVAPARARRLGPGAPGWLLGDCAGSFRAVAVAGPLRAGGQFRRAGARLVHPRPARRAAAAGAGGLRRARAAGRVA